MKIAASIPDRAFESAEKLAARLGVSCSEPYARALASLVEKHRVIVLVPADPEHSSIYRHER